MSRLWCYRVIALLAGGFSQHSLCLPCQPETVHKYLLQYSNINRLLLFLNHICHCGETRPQDLLLITGYYELEAIKKPWAALLIFRVSGPKCSYQEYHHWCRPAVRCSNRLMTLQALKKPGPKPALRTSMCQHHNGGGHPGTSLVFQLSIWVWVMWCTLCWTKLGLSDTKLYLWKAGNYPYDKSHAILTPPASL